MDIAALSANPASMATVAVGMMFLMSTVLIFVLVRRKHLDPSAEANSADTDKLKAAVELALLTRKHVEKQRDAIRERFNDPGAKLSMSSSQDVKQVVELIDQRLNNAMAILNGGVTPGPKK
jgi:hypothetical protein